MLQPQPPDIVISPTIVTLLSTRSWGTTCSREDVAVRGSYRSSRPTMIRTINIKSDVVMILERSYAWRILVDYERIRRDYGSAILLRDTSSRTRPCWTSP